MVESRSVNEPLLVVYVEWPAPVARLPALRHGEEEVLVSAAPSVLEGHALLALLGVVGEHVHGSVAAAGQNG